MWKPAALVALALALEGAFVLNAVVPDAGALRRAAAEARAASPDASAPRGTPRRPAPISAGALAHAR